MLAKAFKNFLEIFKHWGVKDTKSFIADRSYENTWGKTHSGLFF